MQANLENLGTLERRLSIAVPMAEIDQEVDTRLKRLTRTVKMHGFRPGKVPLKVVAQQYGPQVRQEVLGDACRKLRGSRPAAESASRGLSALRGQAALPTARAISSTAPRSRSIPRSRSATSPAYAIERPQLEVGDAEVDKTLEIMRKQRVALRSASSVPRESGDRVTIVLQRHDRRRGIRGRQGRGPDDAAGRRPPSRGFRDAACRHESGRLEIIRAALSGRLSRQGRRRQNGDLRGQRQGGRRAALARSRRGVREVASGVADGDIERCARR